MTKSSRDHDPHNLQGLILTTADAGNFGRIEGRTRSTSHEMTEYAAALLDELEMEDCELTAAAIDAAGFRLGFSPGRTEAARLSALWAGRLRERE